jgi:hypothetical protein
VHGRLAGAVRVEVHHDDHGVARAVVEDQATCSST